MDLLQKLKTSGLRKKKRQNVKKLLKTHLYLHEARLANLKALWLNSKRKASSFQGLLSMMQKSGDLRMKEFLKKKEKLRTDLKVNNSK